MSNIYDPIFECMSNFGYCFDDEYFSASSDVSYLKFEKGINGRVNEITVYINGEGYVTSYFAWDDVLVERLEEVREIINREVSLNKVLDGNR